MTFSAINSIGSLRIYNVLLSHQQLESAYYPLEGSLTVALPSFVVYSICGRVETPCVFSTAGNTLKPFQNPVSCGLFHLAVVRHPLTLRPLLVSLMRPELYTIAPFALQVVENEGTCVVQIAAIQRKGPDFTQVQNVIALPVAPGTSEELTTPGAAVAYWCQEIRSQTFVKPRALHNYMQIQSASPLTVTSPLPAYVMNSSEGFNLFDILSKLLPIWYFICT